MAKYRILILAYDFPPNLSIGGQRPWYWAKHLHEHGVYPIIITRHWNAGLESAADCVKPSASQAIQDVRQDTHRVIRIPFNPGLRDKIFLKNGAKKMRGLEKYYPFLWQLVNIFSLRLETNTFYTERLENRLPPFVLMQF